MEGKILKKLDIYLIDIKKLINKLNYLNPLFS